MVELKIEMEKKDIEERNKKKKHYGNICQT